MLATPWEEHRVEHARHENEELHHDQKMKAVGALAGGIAHEFNNLLQVIGGYARYAMEGISPEHQPFRDLKKVIDAADRASLLTRQLLGFSRRQSLQRRNVDANQLVKEFAQMIGPLLDNHISLELSLGNDVGEVYADNGEVQQALMNLCLNARDAMPSGGRLQIKTARVFLREPIETPQVSIWPGRYVCFTVTDDGYGMSAELQKKIFDPFFTTKSLGKGTGLGLAAVYGTVGQHNGAIRVESEPGKSVTFQIYLPTVAGNVEVDCSERLQPESSGSEMILLAEDDLNVRDFGRRALERAGHTVLVANDGAEAWQLFQDHRNEISVVVLDAMMPRLTGHEVYCLIKAKHPETKTIFCSGYDPETAGIGLIQHEQAPLIRKPYTANELLHAVRTVLDELSRCQQTAQFKD